MIKAQKLNYSFELFADAMRHTREALHKFEKRTCDRILGKQEEKRPTFFTEMMMGLFKRHGVKIHYSTIDNDDTLATHA